MGHAAVGDMDTAFAALERAYQARSAGLISTSIWIRGTSRCGRIQRYAELVRRIGLR